MYLNHDHHDLNVPFSESLSPRTKMSLETDAVSIRRWKDEIKLSDLNQVLSEMEDEIQEALGGAVVLVKRFSPQAIPVRLDLKLIHEMLLNLASSARETVSEHGQFILETRMARLPLNYTQKHPSLTPGSYALLLVQDTAPGLIPAACDYFDSLLFERRLELMNGTSVFTAYGYLQGVNACLSLRSQSEGGTLLHVYFPLA